MNTENMTQIILEMSNFDHVVDEGLAEALKENEGAIYGAHPATNFFGKVYYSNEKYYEEVWRYHSVVDTLSADTLEDLMTLVNDKHGWE